MSKLINHIKRNSVLGKNEAQLWDYLVDKVIDSLGIFVQNKSKIKINKSKSKGKIDNIWNNIKICFKDFKNNKNRLKLETLIDNKIKTYKIIYGINDNQTSVLIISFNFNDNKYRVYPYPYGYMLNVNTDEFLVISSNKFIDNLWYDLEWSSVELELEEDNE